MTGVHVLEWPNIEESSVVSSQTVMTSPQKRPQTAIPYIYRTHFDLESVYSFLETLYISNRLQLPLK